jgi:hypothetical protein
VVGDVSALADVEELVVARVENEGWNANRGQNVANVDLHVHPAQGADDPGWGGKPRQAGPEPILIDALRHFGEEPSPRRSLPFAVQALGIRQEPLLHESPFLLTPGASCRKSAPT